MLERKYKKLLTILKKLEGGPQKLELYLNGSNQKKTFNKIEVGTHSEDDIYFSHSTEMERYSIDDIHSEKPKSAYDTFPDNYDNANFQRDVKEWFKKYKSGLKEVF